MKKLLIIALIIIISLTTFFACGEKEKNQGFPEPEEVKITITSKPLDAIVKGTITITSSAPHVLVKSYSNQIQKYLLTNHGDHFELVYFRTTKKNGAIPLLLFQGHEKDIRDGYWKNKIMFELTIPPGWCYKLPLKGEQKGCILLVEQLDDNYKIMSVTRYDIKVSDKGVVVEKAD